MAQTAGQAQSLPGAREGAGASDMEEGCEREQASGPQGANERGSERERERGSERARGDELWGGIVRGEGAARNSKQSLKHQRQNRFLTSVRLKFTGSCSSATRRGKEISVPGITKS